MDVIGGQDERSTRMMGLDVIRDFAFDSIAPEDGEAHCLDGRRATSDNRST